MTANDYPEAYRSLPAGEWADERRRIDLRRIVMVDQEDWAAVYVDGLMVDEGHQGEVSERLLFRLLGPRCFSSGVLLAGPDNKRPPTLAALASREAQRAEREALKAELDEEIARLIAERDAL